MGGISGADAICEDQKIGNFSAIPSGCTHKAVLAGSGRDPRNLLADSDGPIYQARDGTTVVADTWGDFWDTTYTLADSLIQHSRGFLWMGVNADGSPASSGANCNDWTSNSSSVSGNRVLAHQKGSDRFYIGGSATCNRKSRILCLSY